jgi:predicted PurR-regulated permease PerM
VSMGRWIGLLALGISLYVLWQIRLIVLIFFAAVVFATGLNRWVRRLQQSGASRGAAIALVVGVWLISLGIFSIFIAFPIVDQVDQLTNLLPFSLERLQEWANWLQARLPGRLLESLPDNLEDLQRQFQTVLNWTMLRLYLIFSDILSISFNILLFVALTLMLLANPQPYRNILIQAFPAFYRQRVDVILSKCETRLINYIAGIALSMLFIWIACTIGLLILDVPLPFISGLLAGVLAFIPYLGAILSVFPPALLALIDAPWKVGAVLLLYFVIQQIEGNFVTPIIMKKQVSLLPATTLALLTAFGAVFGFLGLFLGLPILVVAQTWLKEVVVKDILDRWTKP